MEAEVVGTWGTWEELLLGGAVLRHGTRDWTVVAAELRARTLSSYVFTPEVCKAKYEDLQQRYSGAWFEELRKKRVAELKRDLELSEDSIGSLESRLESLKDGKNERRDDCQVDTDLVEPELPVHSEKLERFKSSPKEMSKDGLSAGSFTHETQTKWFHECLLTMSSEDMETKPEVSRSIEHEKVLNVDKLANTTCEGQGGSFKKRRGGRKRKDCSRNINEASVRESDFSDPCKESSTSNCGEVAKSSGINEENMNLEREAIKDMMEILDSVLDIKGASSFYCRHDSQKRGRYKKIIRRHMDFDTIRSRINNQAIKSVMELFRDLLLLANNALVFYSKNTREYKSALLLRTHVTEKLRENGNCFSRNVSVTNANISGTLPVHDPSVKVRKAAAGNRKFVVPKTNGGNNSASGFSHGAKKPSKENSVPSVESLPIKKAFGRQKKIGREAVSPIKEKKRGRTK